MTTPRSLSPSLKWILYSLAFLGLYGTWIRSALNGTLLILFKALHVTGTLPGSKVAVKTSFTGIYWPIDYLLDVLILFFWQAVDGSHPSTSLFGLYFAGQHVAVITTLYVDSYKSDRKDWRINPTLWLLAFQLSAVATSGPWFVLLALSLTQNPSPSNLSISRVTSIRVLPVSILIGYVSLVVAMALPSTGSSALVSPATQQIAIAAWNVFPIFIALSQSISQALSSLYGSSAQDSQATANLSRETAFSAVRLPYAFAFLISLASHVATLAITLSTVLFPTLFSPSAIESLHPARIFNLPLSHAQVPSLGAGAIQFMQWDLLVGFAAVLVLAVVSLHHTRETNGKQSSLTVLSLQVLGAAIVAGPGAVFVGLRWFEDERLLAGVRSKGAVTESAKRKH